MNANTPRERHNCNRRAARAAARIQPVLDQLASTLRTRGRCYQADLLIGSARWSGSDLRGEARKWSAGYARSRQGLLERLADVLPVEWEPSTALVQLGRWRRELVLLHEPTATLWLVTDQLTRYRGPFRADNQGVTIAD